MMRAWITLAAYLRLGFAALKGAQDSAQELERCQHRGWFLALGSWPESNDCGESDGAWERLRAIVVAYCHGLQAHDVPEHSLDVIAAFVLTCHLGRFRNTVTDRQP